MTEVVELFQATMQELGVGWDDIVHFNLDEKSASEYKKRMESRIRKIESKIENLSRDVLEKPDFQIMAQSLRAEVEYMQTQMEKLAMPSKKADGSGPSIVEEFMDSIYARALMTRDNLMEIKASSFANLEYAGSSQAIKDHVRPAEWRAKLGGFRLIGQGNHYLLPEFRKFVGSLTLEIHLQMERIKTAMKKSSVWNSDVEQRIEWLVQPTRIRTKDQEIFEDIEVFGAAETMSLDGRQIVTYVYKRLRRLKWLQELFPCRQRRRMFVGELGITSVKHFELSRHS
jgi:hypothetical protein